MRNCLVAVVGAVIGGRLVQGIWRLGLDPATATWPSLAVGFVAPGLAVVLGSVWLWKHDHRWLGSGLAAGAVVEPSSF